MSIRMAKLSDLPVIRKICTETILAVYPHYYPKGAVDFFLSLHNRDAIICDIESGCVFLCEAKHDTAGTVTVRHNEICRLFVLPEYQKHGYGREMLDFAEIMISKTYSEIILDASLPARAIYLRRDYKESAFHMIPTDNGDFLCYDEMKKQVRNYNYEKKRP